MAAHSFDALLRSLQKGPLAPVYYLHGPEDILKEEAVRMILDSLRYWVNEMHVDGFRFDLASALARELHDVDRLSAFFDVVHQDPVISQVKLIAEPWDLAEGGYIERAEPVLLIGDCGTGKTHLLSGLCVAACRQKRRVRFTTSQRRRRAPC